MLKRNASKKLLNPTPPRAKDAENTDRPLGVEPYADLLCDLGEPCEERF